ncbi:hypothetical protein J7E29_09255 [Streptomyces sp. ISL-90]|nr:hypothetical protein [Streptomyces sp. ISL-90]
MGAVYSRGPRDDGRELDASVLTSLVVTSFRRVDAPAFSERLGYEQLAKKFEKTFATVIDV